MPKIYRTIEHGYVMHLRDMPQAERPRERLLEAGAKELLMTELVAVLWGVGTRKEDVLAMAQRTLKEYGETAVGHELDPRRLSDVANIPLSKACQLVASLELGRRFYARRSGKPVHVRTPDQAYAHVRDIAQSQKEQLRGLYLNTRYQVVHDEVISIGSLTANIVHPREVFQPAIERGAVAVILAHNHPSGRRTPSQADVRLTRQLLQAADILGVELLDHLVVTAQGYTSILTQLSNEQS